MSEYQYYEFLAVDRVLTQDEMRELRGVSSRADITPTRFSNHYNYGDLRGDADMLLEQYFDVFVYVANWGTRRFAMRVPTDAVTWEEIAPYCAGMNVRARRTDRHTIVDIVSDPEDWEEEEWLEDDGWMASLAAVRQGLFGGDLRCLYLGWLLYASGHKAEGGGLDTGEPPVPLGLASLPPALRAFVDFLRIDEDLLAGATEGSAPRGVELAGLGEWIAQLPAREKDDLLLRVAQGHHAGASAALARGFRDASRPSMDKPQRRRTVRELLDRANAMKEARERERKRLAEEARRRHEAAEAAAKQTRLDALAFRKPAAWDEVGSLVESKQQKAYDQAVALLVDLSDLAERDGDERDFAERMSVLLEAHARKPSFIARMDKAGLRTTP